MLATDLAHGLEVGTELGEAECQRVEPEGRCNETGCHEPSAPRHAGIVAGEAVLKKVGRERYLRTNDIVYINAHNQLN